MKTKFTITVLLFCFLLPSICNAQGLNNEYKIDQEDLVHAFSILGLEIYKFPVKAKSKNTFANIIIEKYIDGKLQETRNFYQGMKFLLKMLDEPLNQIITQLSTEKKWIRFYIHSQDSSVTINTLNGNSTREYKISLKGYNLTGSRAFSNLPEFYTQKKRVLTYYANRDGNLIHCPGDATPQEIANLYDLAIIVYIKPITVTENGTQENT